MAIELDEIDVKLLTQLQQDADRTNLELAELAGLSPAATLHRVRRLKESGAIRIVSASVDAAAVGFPLTVFMAVTTGNARATERFEREVQLLPQVIAAETVAGEMDYWLTVVARDVEDLEHTLTRIATHGGGRVVTYLRLKQLKPPTPLPLLPSAAARQKRRS
ncbi:Lrp/AsnC family transcriptional regulator [Kineosporia mesophila]|uniref:Lrp/AsnC family transcriptional regulator n=1 Tax=Kineosporia mesophila TaxID=566012 RepID=A0ABP6YTZ3_9ACTN|nr:Lrp/AsnC family transcriptional regulator [Kineosporia mesophila]MCD5352215.1 Lrp/AsnC family transcriptional regulator [Kineosporia mesophila]